MPRLSQVHPSVIGAYISPETFHGPVMTYVLLQALPEHRHYVMIFGVWVGKALRPTDKHAMINPVLSARGDVIHATHATADWK